MSDWTANACGAAWYGECTFGGDGWTDYNYGYSNDEDPDARDLCPEGATILDFATVALETPNSMDNFGELSY